LVKLKIKIEKFMQNKTEALRVRLTDEEASAFKKYAEKYGLTRSKLMRKMIRESINETPDFISNEQSVMIFTIRQLVGVSNNLNQITQAIHTGKAHRTIDEKYLLELKKCVMDVKIELESHIKKTKNRWVKK
jgi:predicted DNA-binding protein